MIKNVSPAEITITASVVLNWQQEFKRRVPTR
jgi:hypothetical protein